MMKRKINVNVSIVGSTEEGELHISYNYGNDLQGIVTYNPETNINDAKNEAAIKALNEVKKYLS